TRAAGDPSGVDGVTTKSDDGGCAVSLVPDLRSSAHTLFLCPLAAIEFGGRRARPATVLDHGGDVRSEAQSCAPQGRQSSQLLLRSVSDGHFCGRIMRSYNVLSSLAHASALVVLLAFAGGCGAKSSDDLSDSQGHWLKHCDEHAECGAAACLCGVCTSKCTTDADCWRLGASAGSRCASVRIDGCPQLGEGASVCVPDCPNDDCLSVQSDPLTTSDESDGSTSTALELSTLEFEEYSVPKCPAVAPTTSLPMVSVRPSVAAYEGVVTVQDIQQP